MPSVAGEIVGFFGTFGNPTAPGDNVFTSTAWLRFPAFGDRLYLITCTPLRCDNASFTAQDLETKWVVTDSNGNGPTDLGGTIVTVDNSMPLDTSVLFAISDDPEDSATVTFALQSREAGGGTNLSYVNNGGWNIYAIDVGPYTQSINAGAGGIGTPSGNIELQKTYFATDTQTYDGSGNPLGGDGELWRGDFPDDDPDAGNTRSICIFDGASIRSDLASAVSIDSAELWMYCINSEENMGSLGYNYSTATTPPGTLSAGTVEYAHGDEYPIGQWHGVSILGGYLDDILNNSANAIHITAPLLGLAATKFGGYADITKRPYLKINYTVAP